MQSLHDVRESNLCAVYLKLNAVLDVNNTGRKKNIVTEVYEPPYCKEAPYSLCLLLTFLSHSFIPSSIHPTIPTQSAPSSVFVGQSLSGVGAGNTEVRPSSTTYW